MDYVPGNIIHAQVKEVLRLLSLGLNSTRSPAVARSARRPCTGIWRAAAAKVTWPLPDDLDERRLDELLFPKRPNGARPRSD